MVDFKQANVFDLTHTRSFTCEMGQLVPSMLLEVIPGDTIECSSEIFSRLQALIAPAFQHINQYLHVFYVPKRILFDKWEDYISGGFEGDDNTPWPYMVAPEGGYAIGSLADYLGLQVGVAGYKHSALPFRAYAKVINDWFRDQNVQEMLPLSKGSGLDTTTNTSLINRCWEKDYYTSCLPWVNRGGEEVYLPIGTTAPVAIYGNGKGLGLTDGTNDLGVYRDGNASALNVKTGGFNQNVGTAGNSGTNGAVPNVLGLVSDASKSGIVGVADLSASTATPIPTVRKAFQLNNYLNALAQGGVRYNEFMANIYGMNIGDGRIQRSEYIYGGKSPVMISPVEQNSATSDVSPQGHLAGRADSLSSTSHRTKTIPEEGYLIGLYSMMPRTIYHQGVQKLWTRESRYDHFNPYFVHLGPQEVKNREIYVQGTDDDNEPFGYRNIYDEYRHQPSTVHGQFRPGGNLDFYTQARSFDSLPQLNDDFVTCTPSNRIFAVTEGVDTHIECQVLHHIKALRQLPAVGYGGLIDHR